MKNKVELKDLIKKVSVNYLSFKDEFGNEFRINKNCLFSFYINEKGFLYVKDITGSNYCLKDLYFLTDEEKGKLLDDIVSLIEEC